MNENFTIFHEGRPNQSKIVRGAPHSGVLVMNEAPEGKHDYTPEYLHTHIHDLPDFVRENIRWECMRTQIAISSGVDIAAPLIADLFSNDAENSGDAIIASRAPRAVMPDINRLPHEVDKKSVDLASPNQPKTGHANGAIWRSTVVRAYDIKEMQAAQKNPDAKTMILRPYTKIEFDELQRLSVTPYDNAVREAVTVRKDNNGFGVFIESHTFPAHIPGKIANGPHAGAYIVGPKIKGNKELSMENLMNCLAPHVILIAKTGNAEKPLSCHPRILVEFAKPFVDAGLIVSLGNGPFVGGSAAKFGDPENGHHAIGVEVIGGIGEDELEPGRADGKLKVNKDAALKMQKLFNEAYARIANIKADKVASVKQDWLEVLNKSTDITLTNYLAACGYPQKTYA
jgi:N-formylglutamate amidohydrolase